MTKSFLSLLLGTAMLAGCNLAPKYERPGGAVPATLPQGGIYPTAPTDAVDVSRIGWRDFFLDQRLQQVIEMGLANNRDLRIAAGNVLQARAQYRVQRADLLPTVSANGTATYTNNIFGAGQAAGGGVGANPGASSSQDIEIYQASVGLSAFELDLFGRVRNLSRAAQEQYFATEEAQRSARISLIAEIANAWLTMASDQEQLRLSRETLGAFEETLRLRCGRPKRTTRAPSATSPRSRPLLRETRTRSTCWRAPPCRRNNCPQDLARSPHLAMPCRPASRRRYCCAGPTCFRPSTS
jgi:outer membrane protein, multidrug efflux system